MHRLFVVTAAFMSLGAATVANAAVGSLVATLESPVAKETAIIAGGAAWRCAQSSCVLTSDSSVDYRSACREIAKKVGTVTQFGTATQPYLDAAKLAKCNGK